MKQLITSIIILFLLISCNKSSKTTEVERAFYYWQGNSSIDETESNEVKKHSVKKLYYKMFEVDYSDAMGNFPYEKNFIRSYHYKDLDTLEIIPTIYIRNEIFQYNDEKSLEKLADNISFLIHKNSIKTNEYTNKIDTNYVYNEIQIDCDWTKSTKEKYFYLLKKIKQISKKRLSCTLRLYPYKYPEIMGIPPVDAATLMCYNLIKPLSNQEKNSILDIQELSKYLDKPRDYPVHLDIALPVFSWAQLYQNNQFVKILPLNDIDFKNYTKPLEPMWFEVTQDTEIDWDNYLRKGDRIKYEEVKPIEIHRAINLIKKNVTFDAKTTIILFDLNQNVFKKYTYEEIKSFYTTFSK